MMEPEKKPGGRIVIDETRLHGEQVYVWMARRGYKEGPLG